MSFELGGNNDTEIFSRDEMARVPETVCAFANSSGGRIICDGFDPSDLIPPEIPYIPEAPDTVYIPPLEWNRKPASLRGRVYRRIEGQNVISGFGAKSIIAGDSLEPSRDDYPVKNVSLNEHCIDAFTSRVAELNVNMRHYSRLELLRMCGVYSGKYLTFAGALMFGNILRVRAVLDYSSGHAEISSPNIWKAYTDILPRLTHALSEKCAEAFREVFINSLLHSDYNAGRRINIRITSSPPIVLTDNPGTVRGVIRNYRLKRIFSLSGIATCKQQGLKIIRAYMPSFTLKQDMLNLRTRAILRLEGKGSLPEPVML